MLQPELIWVRLRVGGVGYNFSVGNLLGMHLQRYGQRAILCPRSPLACAVVIEGMGRAVHTNYFTRLTCDCLKLAMIKNKHLAQSLFKGDVYDCVCRFDEGVGHG